MDNHAQKKEITHINLPSIKSKNPFSENPGPQFSQNKDNAENKLRTMLEDDEIFNVFLNILITQKLINHLII